MCGPLSLVESFYSNTRDTRDNLRRYFYLNPLNEYNTNIIHGLDNSKKIQKPMCLQGGGEKVLFVHKISMWKSKSIKYARKIHFLIIYHIKMWNKTEANWLIQCASLFKAIRLLIYHQCNCIFKQKHSRYTAEMCSNKTYSTITQVSVCFTGLIKVSLHSQSTGTLLICINTPNVNKSTNNIEQAYTEK